MTDVELLLSLRSRGVVLRVEGDALRYNAPKGVMTPELLSALKAHKQGLIALLSGAGGAPSEQVEPIRPLDRDAPRVASFAQQRLWFLDQLEPGKSTYNVPFSLRIAGPLDVPALARALSEIVRRHEVLRTTFSARDGGPALVVREPAPIALHVEDLGEGTARAIAEEAARPFGLEAGPLLRARLFVIEGGDHVLVVVMHHIASDGWSLNVIVRELDALYEAFAAGKPSPLPALAIQYADYAAWQAAELAGERLLRHLAFYRAEIDGAPRVLDLPSERARPPARSGRGRKTAFHVPIEVASALELIASRAGATLFMVAASAFELYLYKLTGQRDFLFGTPVAGRTRPEIEPLIGFFVSTLVLRSDVAEGGTFLDLVGRVRERCVRAFAHQELPFERLVQAIEPDRDPSRTPLVQAVFALQTTADEAPRTSTRFRLGGVSSSSAAEVTAKFDLTVVMTRTPRGLSGSIETSSDLFDEAAAARMIAQFTALLSSIAEGADRDVGALSIVPDADRALVAGAWTRAEPVEYPRDASIHALFAAEAARSPGVVALVTEEREVTYRALDERANKIARALLDRGVKKGALIGLYGRRSIDLIAATIGILKAGSAYVPLDPAYPAARLAWMIEDAAMPVIVAVEPLPEGLDRHGAEVLDVARDGAAIDAYASADPEVHASGEDLAYVMYTSGSTGKPKGVCIPHRGVVRLVRGARYIPFGPSEVFVQLSSYAFDASTLEVWGALLHGAKLVVPPPGLPTFDEIGRILAAHRVTTSWLTAGLFNAMIEAHPEGLASVRRVLTGGEALSVPHVRRALELLGGVELYNAYGPTESTTFATTHRITGADGPIPIGRPIESTSVFILDRWNKPVPVGVPGELYIGGDGLARGYLNRPELTAERFVTVEPFGRLYKTGDRVRWQPDGSIAFVGRLDDQVKIRGFRIELGEVEAALQALPGVREAVAIVRQRGPESSEKHLVAYVVAHDGTSLTERALKDALAASLPAYLVPSAIVLLDAMPLNPNGKVDKKALPEPHFGDEERALVAPSGPVEEAIAAIFADVLKLPSVSADAGFFDLGGHSLLATRAIARIRAALSVELPLRALFEAPSVSELGRVVGEALRERHGASAPPLTALARDESPRALSFAQERLWFLDQLDPNSSAYNVPIAVRHAEAIDQTALRRALDAIAARHDVLRTVFREGPSGPVAIARADLGIPLAVVQVESDAALRSALAEEAKRPFDLVRGPLARAVLFVRSDRDQTFSFTMHHIVSDGWSIEVLSREIAALYDAFLAGEPSPLAELPIQYADYAAWQRAWLSGETLDRELGYWRDRLAGAPPSIELATDRPRPAVPSQRGALRPIVIEARIAEGLRAIARGEGATLFMVLLAGFFALMQRSARQDDVVIGSPIAGRSRAETEGLIGFFVNTLALRATVDARAPFRALLAQVKETCLGAYAHQDVPFERIVEALDPVRDLSRHPIFQIAFALQDIGARAPASAAKASHGAPVSPEATAAKFDLTVALRSRGDAISGSIEYAVDLFDPETVDALAARYVTLLASIVEGAEKPVSALAIMTPEERARVTVTFNQTATDYPRDAGIHELFARAAATSPDAVALQGIDQSVTYAALDRETDHLARALVDRGVGPDQPVCLYGRRSIDLIVATIAVLKAGGAYVPLDPTYPEERLAWMARDAGARVLIAVDPAPDLAVPGLAIVTMDALRREPASDRALPRGPWGERLAYVMYTSGSTGVPKGVMIPHRGVVRLVMGARWLDFGPSHVFAQLSSYAFDAATLELWGALLHGGKLVVPGPEMPSFEDMGRLFAGSGVTTLWLTAGLFNAIIEAHPAALASVKRIFTGGEALSVPHVKKALGELPGTELYNGYGPTESTTFTTTHRITSADGLASVPIGRPISNTTAYVLDPALGPVPVGVTGELYIGGDGLARGYLERPELTAERFVDVPPYGRLYKTGDLVRWLPDGALTFVGRTDDQVKIRGFRIELGEVESALGALPGVRESVAVVRLDTGDKRLVAYVVPQRATALTVSDLRDALRAKLPHYMVPSAVVLLDRLPLNPNGKVDKKALPAPDLSDERAFVAPRDAIEEALAAIFAEVLKVDAVSVIDGFFDLGGHSIRATQVAARVRASMGVDLPLRALFEAPTVEALAEKIRAAKPEAREEIPRAPRDPSGKVPLSFSQERLWFLDQLDPASVVYNVPFAIRLAGALDEPALSRALDALIARHEVLRTTFAIEDGVAIGKVEPDLHIPISITEHEGMGAAERLEIARSELAMEARVPFDLANRPVIRVKIVRFASDDHLLVGAIHHVACDGWSMGIVNRELGALYRAFSEGAPSPLPELPIAYADYAAWQRKTIAGERLGRSIAYFREALAGAKFALDLPTDRPRPPVMTYAGARRSFLLDAELTEALKALGKREGATLFMVLLAAFGVVLGRAAGESDVLFGSPVANRSRAEVEGLIGFFVNTLVLRVTVDERDTFSAHLAKVRETVLGAFTHEDTPFEKLVEALAPARDPSRTPLFQVSFSLQNTGSEALALGGVKDRAVRGGSVTSKFDLTVALAEGARGLSLAIEYRTDLFEPATIDRLAARYDLALRAIAASPGARLLDVPTVTEDERATLLDAWNATNAPFPRDRTAHALFEAQAEASPEAIAVIDGEARVTFGALSARVNVIARRLRALGVVPGDRVAIVAPRSAGAVAAFFGALASGGAYLPIDPAYPADRIAFMLSDASPRAILTTRAIADRLPPSSAHVIALDEAANVEESDAPLDHVSRPEHLAYVIYTSGSTGRPKGVMIPHAGLMNYLTWAIRTYEAGAGRGAPVHSSLAFDLTVTSIFAPLSAGKPVTIVPEGREIEALVEVLTGGDGPMSLVKITPAHLELLNRLVPAEKAANAARVFVIGGEALTWQAVSFWREHAKGTRLINEYGPTETVVGCAIYDAQDGEAALPTATVPIGKPIANTRLYVLDALQRPVPIGSKGELYIGGAGVGIGYLNRPDLTAERFLPDPFAREPGARMYRSGDVVRYLPDGNLEFFGRVDHQVKIRGYRIELGEIEAAITEISGVREAAVIVREDVPGDKRLVGYVVAQRDTALTERGLREALAAKLPDHMVPSAFVTMAALPLTSNGKVDRAALPAPEAPRDGDVEAPRGFFEETLATVWSSVLGRAVGPGDDFFTLGGHSLLAVRVMARAAASFGVTLPLQAIFEASTLRALAARFEAQKRAGLGLDLPPIERAPEAARHALSFGQERLWVLQKLDPEDPSYIVPVVTRFEGEVDADAMERALWAILTRHEVLRTVITEVDGEPRAVVPERFAWSLARYDLSAVLEGERAGALASRLRQEAQRPFDLERGPLVRASLLTGVGDKSYLLIASHHIVSDAWSQGVWERELGLFYTAFREGREPALAPLPIQYADYAAWQREHARAALDQQIAYVRAELSGAPRVLDLPIDRPRPAVFSHKGALRAFEVPKDLAASLRALGRAEGATPFMTMLAAFALLLERHSGQTDLLIGTPIANRSQPGTEDLIGFFLNTLVIRAKIDRDRSFRDLVRDVRARCLGAYAHGDVPFERVVSELLPERDMSRTPLFQVSFTLQSTPKRASRGDDGASKGQGAVTAVDLGTAKFDLSLGLGDTGEAMTGVFEYATDLFDPSTIDRWISRFLALLGAIAKGPDAPVRALEALGDRERSLLTGAWCAPSKAPLIDARLHDLVAAQIARTPGAPAIVFGSQTLTFAEFGARASALASVLVASGVTPGALVGVLMERSLELPVALYAVLAAGAAYVPIDPTYPPDRVHHMMTDTGAKVVITQQKLVSQVPGGISAVAADAPGLLEGAREAPAVHVGAESPAYVIYTSGSTGKPKGAVIPHRAIVNHMTWMLAEWPLGAGDAVLQKTPISFDASVWEFWAPLMSGARLVMAEPDGHRDPAYLARAVAEHHITELQLVPSMFELFLAEPDLGRCTSLKRLFCGGEALLRAYVERFMERHPADVINLYGPTETAIDATFWVCKRGEQGPSVEPIGHPIANMRAYVVDGAGRLAPIGAPGELLLGGEGVGLGYWKRPDLTRERFVAGSSLGVPGAPEVLYKTGDLCRFNASGALEYLGRIDHQVKIRGFRIELGEVEVALSALPGVRDAAVTAHGEPGKKRLAGYLVYEPSTPPYTALELRSRLQSVLPEHMIPSAFVAMESLPLLGSGKVDRAALPEPGEAPRERGEGARREPRSALEKTLAAVWSGVLKVADVGIDDNFFALGGDSIQAIQIVARARQAGITISPRQMFTHQTIAELAEVALVARAVSADQGPITGSAPLTPIQRAFLGYAEGPLANHFNQAFFFELTAPASAAAMEAAVRALLTHHDALRLRIGEGEGGPEQRFIAPEPAALDAFLRVDVGGVEDSELAGAIAATARRAQASLDVAEGPIVRVILFQSPSRPARADRLLLVIHHLAVDGVSWRVIFEDLWTAYDQAARGEPVTLPPKTTSFKHWSERLAAYARSPAVLSERGVWREHAHGPSLRADIVSGDDTEETARHVTVSLSAEDTERLLKDAHEAYSTTVNELLLTALLVASEPLTGAPSLLVDLEGHGREDLFDDVDVTRTVGWFTTIFPVLLRYEPDPYKGLGAAIVAVKEAVRELPNKGIGYGLLASAGQIPVARPSIAFNYLGRFDTGGGDDKAPRVKAAKEPMGPTVSPAMPRRHLVDVDGSVSGGRLSMRFTYSTARFRGETIDALAERFIASLRAVLAHCASSEAGYVSPADFQKVKVTQDMLDDLALLDPSLDPDDLDQGY